MLLSDPYSPKTEKQISFYKGFVLVMRHGPYLTLTAAFLFITVAIQVNAGEGATRPSGAAAHVKRGSPGFCRSMSIRSAQKSTY